MDTAASPTHAETQHPGNRLAGESSAYLKSAAHQPVHWRPWGPEAFEEARRLDRPILLDIGAVWCHWCHVMDGESYEDPEVAAIINERFVAVKVDRDERPDVDRRYQEAVGAIAGQGGWPLTGFLTPDGKVYYGGTYFPPDSRYGRPGFKHVLTQVADFYHQHKQDALGSADRLLEELRKHQGADLSGSRLGPEMVDRALGSMSASFDIRNGGFGRAPKFPHTGAIQLLIRRYAETGEPWMETVVRVTLEKMARGGIHDQIGGGFHRYSVDERWIVPHFEKMAYDNSELLRNYVEGYRLLGVPHFRETALGILRWVDTVLSDRDQGGFYASQDADIDLSDDGDYFTWTLDEAREALTEEELAVLRLHYDIAERGEMHHNPAKNVLFVDLDPPEIAQRLGMEEEAVHALLESGRRKLSEARARRPAPFVDRTLYANWNGMMAAAYFLAGQELDLPDCTAFAAKTLDRLIKSLYTPGQGFAHAEGVPGFLDDQVQMAAALVAGYETTGDLSYLAVAREVMDGALRRFWDPEGGGFFDVEEQPQALGMLAVREKPIQDSPSPSANGVAALVLDRLYYLTGEARYREHADQTLLAFAEGAAALELYAATYFAALDHHLHRPLQVVVTGDRESPEAHALLQAARRAYRPGRILRRMSAVAQEGGVPEAVRGMAQAQARRGGEALAYVCAGETCAPPTSDPEELKRLVTTFGRRAR